MITVRYTANGQAIADAQIDAFIDQLISLNQQTGRAYADVGCFLVIDGFRAAVASGKISHTDIVFKYDEHTIELNAFAKPIDWPRGFDSQQSEYLRTIITSAARKYKSEKAL